MDLIYNNINDDGAKEIADALKDNTSLQSLDLNGNEIGFDGEKKIANALKGYTSLQSCV